MPRIIVLFLFIFHFVLAPKHSVAQTPKDSCGLQISLLTCSPGDELYSIFGHSALRVIDRINGYDIIFNYGTFDFSDPDFYTKFIRGKLLYFVSVQDFIGFREDYRYENRNIIEQELMLSCQEKEQLFFALRENMKEENRYYKYDFLFDNCSTRLRDIVERNTTDSVHFGNIVGSNPPSFREMIHDYLRKGNMYWSRLGIDILLGSKIDVPVNSKQAMFLPDYLMYGFDSARIDRPMEGGINDAGNKLAAPGKTILVAEKPTGESSVIFRPVVLTSILMVIIGILQFSRRRWATRFLYCFDLVFFALLGSLGFLLLFMWFGTDHVVTKNNYNLLWALPTHFPVAFFIFKRYGWVRAYFTIMAAWYFILFFTWSLLPQDMNSAIAPIVVIAFMRSIVRYRKKTTNEKNKEPRI